MAGVQLPDIKRFSPDAEAPVSVGRIETNVPDGTKVLAQGNNDSVKLVEAANTYMDKAEDYAIHDATTEAANTFEKRVRSAHGEAKKIVGDPTKAYSDIETNTPIWMNEVMDNYKDSSSKMQSAIRQRLNKVNYRLSDTAATNQALQTAVYGKRLSDERVALDQNAMLDSIESVDGMNRLDQNVDNIRNELIARGRQQQLVTTKQNPDGTETEVYSPILQMQMKTEISKGLKTVIESLNRSDPEKAKAIMEKYHDDILSDTRNKLVADHSDQASTREAFGWSNKVRYMEDSGAAAKYLNDNVKDPEVLHKALGFVDADRRHVRTLEQDSSRHAFDDAYNMYRNNPGKYPNYAAFAADPESPTDRLAPKDEEKMRKLIELPQVSDQNVKQKLYTMLQTGKLTGMSPPDFFREKAGLNDSDGKMFEKKWSDINDDTTGEKRQQAAALDAELKRQGITEKFLKTTYSKMNDKQAAVFTTAHNAMMDSLTNGGLPKNASPDQINKWVRAHVADFYKGIAFNQQPVEAAPKIESSPSPTPKPAAAIKEAAQAPPTSEQDIQKWTLKYKQANPQANAKTTKLKDILDFAAKQKALGDGI